MKKLFTLILALLMTLSFASCGGECPEKATPDNPTIEPNTPEVVTPDVPETPAPPEDTEAVHIAVEQRVYTCSNNFTLEENNYVFNSRPELDAFYEANAKTLGDDFVEFTAKYDDAYFADHSLIGVLFTTVHGAVGKEKQLVKMGSKYYLTVSAKDVGGMTNDVWPSEYIFAEPESGHKFDVSKLVVYRW